MKKNVLYKFTLLFIIIMILSSLISFNMCEVKTKSIIIEPLYDNIWGAIYNAEKDQCDDTPTITGDGSKINPYTASEHRWVAISQEMLNSDFRVVLLNNDTSVLYKGKIQYGDTIWVLSPNKNINGWWIVHDTKNQRYRNTIDFLQTKGDGRLYSNDPMWNGRFDSIQIYKINDAELLGLTKIIT
jgi:hypothetical protein